MTDQPDLPTSAAIPGVLTGVGPDVDRCRQKDVVADGSGRALAPKFVHRPGLASKRNTDDGGASGITSLATGDRDPLILDCEGIDVEAVRLCTDHDTPLDAEQRCSHGHVARWWRVEVNGRIQYDGRKFSSVEDDVSETYAGPTLTLKASTETQAAEGGRGAREGVGGAA